MHKQSRQEKLVKLFDDFLDIYSSIKVALPNGFIDKEIKECLKLIEQLKTEEFPIAFFGPFSTGKSTVINAILEREVLKSGMDATTAIPAHIRIGSQDNARVIYKDGKSDVVSLDEARELYQGHAGLSDIDRGHFRKRKIKHVKPIDVTA